MSINIILKSGQSFIIKCTTFQLNKNADQEIIGFDIDGITENKPIHIDVSEIAAIVRLYSDEKK